MNRPAEVLDGVMLETLASRLEAGGLLRIATLQELGLGYLALGRSTPTLSPGEMQRLRIATQLRSGLFGVVYVLDEPSAGLHPADAEPLLEVEGRIDRRRGLGQEAEVPLGRAHARDAVT